MSESGKSKKAPAKKAKSATKKDAAKKSAKTASKKAQKAGQKATKSSSKKKTTPKAKKKATAKKAVATKATPKKASATSKPKVIASTLPEAPTMMDRPQFGLMRGALMHGPRGFGPVVDQLRRKRWIYVGIMGDDFVAAAATVDLGYASNAFAYMGRFDADAPVEYTGVGLPGSARANRSRSHFQFGRASIEIVLPTDDEPGYMRSHTPVGIAKRLAIDVELTRIGGAPITSIGPMDDRWTLSVKDTTIWAKGLIRAAGHTPIPVDAPATFDINDLYSLRETIWNWSAFVGTATDGRRVGLNLLRDNNQGPQDRENVVWIDGEPHQIGVLDYHFDPDRPLEMWTIKGGGVDLQFFPAGQYAGANNIGVVVSRFAQVYGSVRGTVSVGGDTLTLRDVTGVCEDHYALW